MLFRKVAAELFDRPDGKRKGQWIKFEFGALWLPNCSVVNFDDAATGRPISEFPSSCFLL
jgi:hypothetical protein